MTDSPIALQLHDLFAYQQAVDMKLLISVTDRNGVIKSANPKLCQLSKYAEPELVGKNFSILNSGYHSEEFFKNMWDTLLAGNVWKGELRNRAKDGSYFWVEKIIVPIFNQDQEVEEFLSVGTLITELKEAEFALIQNKERSEALLNAIPEMISLSTPSGKRSYMNSIFIEFFGKTSEELKEWDYSFADRETIDKYLAQLSALTPLNPNVTTLIQLENAHGELRWILWSETGIFDDNGTLIEILSLGKDVTKIKETQEEIVNQKRFTEGILNNIPADITVFDDQHRYVFINQQGLQNESMRNWLIGKTDFDFCELKGIDKTQAEIRRNFFNKALTTGEQIEWIDEHLSATDDRKYILRKFYPYKEGGKIKYIIGYGIDVTSVKKADEQKDAYIRQLEEIAYATSHKVRHSLVNLQALVPMLEEDNLSVADRKKVLQYINDCTNSLDEFTRELSQDLHSYKEQLKPGE